MFTLSYTKVFTGGILNGITYNGTMDFATELAAADWARWAEKGCDRPIAGDPYTVTDWCICPKTN